MLINFKLKSSQWKSHSWNVLIYQISMYKTLHCIAPQHCTCVYTLTTLNLSVINQILVLVTSPPEGVARYCFRGNVFTLSVCVCVCVCPGNILVFYFSSIWRDIDLKLYRILIGCTQFTNNIMTFIGQRSRAQGRYIAFSHKKTEP